MIQPPFSKDNNRIPPHSVSQLDKYIEDQDQEQQIKRQEHLLLLNLHNENDKELRLSTKTNNLQKLPQTHRPSHNSNHPPPHLSPAQQIHQYRRITQHLSLVSTLKKVNSQKLKKLQKNISNLDFLRRLSFKETLKLQNKREKLEETQNMVMFLGRLREEKHRKEEEANRERRVMCTSLRQSITHNKSLSQSMHHIVKEQRIKHFRQQNDQLLTKHEKSLEHLLQQNRLKAQSTRQSELRLKEKLKKYEEYKVYMGRMNYEKKLQGEFQRHRENSRYLREVGERMKQEEGVFRKTERLKKESRKIQEFYLTGTGDV